MANPTPNGDESVAPSSSPGIAPFIGNFHKTLPHNKFGEVIPSDYVKFQQRCLEIEGGSHNDFEGLPEGDLVPPFHPGADPRATTAVARFTSPLAGAATELLGLDPRIVEMPPAPGIRSLSTAAEMVELYWMALLRDEPLHDFSSNPKVVNAAQKLAAAFTNALDNDHSEGRLRLLQDLPRSDAGTLDLRPQTLFRCGLENEDRGPLVSQFFLHDIPYGVQTIAQVQTPYLRETDFLTGYEDWLRAQNTGKDKWGRDYGACNNYADQDLRKEHYYPKNEEKRHISTIRDLARFVNRDALHQAYFNAALFLDSIGAPVDEGNPYGQYKREGGFATLGGPDLLTLVSEVASRALKVVWRQKWLVHRRARPEVYGGLLEMQLHGVAGEKRDYGLPTFAADSEAGKLVLASSKDANKAPVGTYFLPMAFSAGSPPHPAYGAGHATVAGACVTVLKAWFREEAVLQDLLKDAKAPENHKERRDVQGLLQPGKHIAGEKFHDPAPYTGGDAAKMTVGGELNKIASNVAMGRSMGGVHWRSDNTRSLRIGEQVAIEILRKRSMEYAEKPLSFTFRSFDRKTVKIANGAVT